MVGIKEYKEDGAMIKSTNHLIEDVAKKLDLGPAVSGVLSYTGSEFAYDVQQYLR